jgi:hypothetical protein
LVRFFDDFERGIVRVDSHQPLANASVFSVDILGLLVQNSLIQRLQILSLWSEFVCSVLFTADLPHLSQQNIVLVIDLQQPVCIKHLLPRLLISSLRLA